MTAGRVAVPRIVPLCEPSTSAPRNHVMSSTLIEITTTDLGQVDVFYTLDGKPPELNPKVGWQHQTRLYSQPFTLPNTGQNVVKAIAVNRTTNHESKLITRTFYVQDEALDALSTRPNSAQSRSEWSAYKHVLRTASASGRRPTSRPNSRGSRKSRPVSRTSSRGSLNSVAAVPPRPRTTSSGNRKVPQTSITIPLICFHCCAPRPVDSKYCMECGALFASTAQARPGTADPNYKPVTMRQSPIDELIDGRPVMATVICRHCKHTSDANAAFCGGCGKKTMASWLYLRNLSNSDSPLSGSGGSASSPLLPPPAPALIPRTFHLDVKPLSAYQDLPTDLSITVMSPKVAESHNPVSLSSTPASEPTNKKVGQSLDTEVVELPIRQACAIYHHDRYDTSDMAKYVREKKARATYDADISQCCADWKAQLAELINLNCD